MRIVKYEAISSWLKNALHKLAPLSMTTVLKPCLLGLRYGYQYQQPFYILSLIFDLEWHEHYRSRQVKTIFKLDIGSGHTAENMAQHFFPMDFHLPQDSLFLKGFLDAFSANRVLNFAETSSFFLSLEFFLEFFSFFLSC